jgi:hypothetical protein
MVYMYNIIFILEKVNFLCVFNIFLIHYFFNKIIIIVGIYRGLDGLFFIYSLPSHQLWIERSSKLIRIYYPSFLGSFVCMVILNLKSRHVFC